MKTPEQWLREYDFMGGEYDKPERFIPIIQAIQADAIESHARDLWDQLEHPIKWKDQPDNS